MCAAPDELVHGEELFALEYLASKGNAAAAAASRLLRKVKVQKFLEREQAECRERLRMDADEVLYLVSCDARADDALAAAIRSTFVPRGGQLGAGGILGGVLRWKVDARQGTTARSLTGAVRSGDMRHARPLDGLTIKAALVLGFGLILGLWLSAGYDFTRRIAAVERDAAAINARYMQAQGVLSTIPGQILLGSVYVRDALLDPDPARADEYRRHLENTYVAIALALRQYVPVLDIAVEQERVGRLRLEVDVFRSTMLEVLGSDRSRWPREARLLLNRLVMPRREAVIRAADDAQALNRAAFVQQQHAIADIYQDLQDRVWQRLGFALAASLGIALVAILYSGRLENRLRGQQVKDAQNSRDLQRLSAQLIQAQEEERRTIARELHDEVGQVLMAIKVELACAQRAITARQGPEHLLDEAGSITDGALRVVRDLSHLLHPALLDDLGLAAAVDWHVRGFARRHAVKVDLRSEGLDGRLTPHIEVAAFRIVQEALTNVAKHARANTCVLRLRRFPHAVRITIEDDGVGFDATETERTGGQRGLGLIGIRERVAQLNGTFRLDSGPNTGTTLTVELPLDAPTATAATEVVASAAEAGFARGQLS